MGFFYLYGNAKKWAENLFVIYNWYIKRGDLTIDDYTAYKAVCG